MYGIGQVTLFRVKGWRASDDWLGQENLKFTPYWSGRRLMAYQGPELFLAFTRREVQHILVTSLFHLYKKRMTTRPPYSKVSCIKAGKCREEQHGSGRFSIQFYLIHKYFTNPKGKLNTFDDKDHEKLTGGA
ncbi:hypothetical protein AMECASPLE_008206 [Ameca splendens]|uniref:Uncharacterized protein n=1 Tax=Ameca splendens TaxID=208324 RepID=A0ABV0YAZ4_9TELE